MRRAHLADGIVAPVKLTAVELRQISLPLVSPFRTSFGTEHEKQALLVRAISPDSEGWGECVAMSDPLYSYEYLAGAREVIVRFLLPRLFGVEDLSPVQVGRLLAPVKGHLMAKAALEMAVLDAELRHWGQPLSGYLEASRDRVPSGVSVGIMDSVPQLLDAVAGYLDAGYVRIKLKIEPGWDLEPVKAVREQFGPDILLQVDANTAYTLADAGQLARLDPFDLLLIEQPLAEDDIRGHAELSKRIATPVCLDESVTSAATAAAAIAWGACQVINVKPGRVGGYIEARRIATVAAAHGIPVWCGGMLETGIGRAANAALAAGPEFTLPGDVSASNRFYAEDITAPLSLVDGHIPVPTGAGIGVEICQEVLQRATVSTETITP
jgi:o-succinylbenzoate synthase